MNRGSNPLGLGLVLVGAFAMAIAAFLPLNESTGIFRGVSDNTLIQHGGWVLIALAVGIAAAGFGAGQRGKYGWALPAVISAVAGVRILMWATDKGLHTLYPMHPDGSLDTSQPSVASLGIAIYVAGAGVAVALAGSLMLSQTTTTAASQATKGLPPPPAQAKTKKCPDCAETILADAKVCKHCSYRFATSAAAAPQAQSPKKTAKKVRCHKCQHVQSVPASQPTFVCEKCETKLRRKAPSAESSF